MSEWEMASMRTNQKRKMKHRNDTFIIAIHYDNKGRGRRRRREVSYSHHGRCDVNPGYLHVLTNGMIGLDTTKVRKNSGSLNATRKKSRNRIHFCS